MMQNTSSFASTSLQQDIELQCDEIRKSHEEYKKKKQANNIVKTNTDSTKLYKRDEFLKVLQQHLILYDCFYDVQIPSYGFTGTEYKIYKDEHGEHIYLFSDPFGSRNFKYLTHDEVRQCIKEDVKTLQIMMKRSVNIHGSVYRFNCY